MATYKKAVLGYEDISFDTQGSGRTFQVKTSADAYRTVSLINASHIPATSTLRAKKVADGTAVSAVSTNIDGILVQVCDDLEDLGQPDGSTLTVASNVLKVKDAGITATQLATNAVETAKILADNVTNAKMATDAVAGSASGASGDNCIEAASIDTADLADESIDSDLYVDGSIDNDHVADSALKAAKFYDTHSGYIVYHGKATISGGATSEVESVPGVLSGDAVVATTLSTTTAVTYCGKALPATDQITFYFYNNAGAIDPGASVVSYIVIRDVT